MRFLTPFLLLAGLSACLDFDQFRADGTSTSSSGGAPTGGAGQGAGVTNVGGGGEGGMGTGGTGGDGGSTAELGPCFPAMPLTDDFNGGENLSWASQGVNFVADQAELVFTTGVPASMSLAALPGVLNECYFQVEFVSASDGIVYLHWRGTSDPSTQVFGFYVQNGEPHVQFLPSNPDPNLRDDTSFTSGFVRIGEEGGVYFVDTSSDAAGPWLRRFSSTAPPGWLLGQGYLVIGAGSANATAVIDNLN